MFHSLDNSQDIHDYNCLGYRQMLYHQHKSLQQHKICHIEQTLSNQLDMEYEHHRSEHDRDYANL